MELKNLNGINKIRFNDFSEYISEKSNNGGCYGFWTDYSRIDDDNFEITYGTTSEFEYCPICNEFGHTYDNTTCGEPETISTDKLLEEINNFHETDSCYYEIRE